VKYVECVKYLNFSISLPSRRGAAPIKQMPRYLKIGAAREVRPFLQEWFDLPGRADFLR
jgi:hypothetical protein